MGKVMGPGKFPLRFWKCLGDVSEMVDRPFQ